MFGLGSGCLRCSRRARAPLAWFRVRVRVRVGARVRVRVRVRIREVTSVRVRGQLGVGSGR